MIVLYDHGIPTWHSRQVLACSIERDPAAPLVNIPCTDLDEGKAIKPQEITKGMAGSASFLVRIKKTEIKRDKN